MSRRGTWLAALLLLAACKESSEGPSEQANQAAALNPAAQAARRPQAQANPKEIPVGFSPEPPVRTPPPSAADHGAQAGSAEPYNPGNPHSGPDASIPLAPMGYTPD